MERKEFIDRLNTDSISLLQILILFIFIKTGKKVTLKIHDVDIFSHHEFFTGVQQRVFNEYTVVTLFDSTNNIIRYY